jgi:CBS domain-containing protein
MFAVQCTTFVDIKYHVLALISMSIESVSVGNIMVKAVKTASENQTVKAIAEIMSESNIGSVVIVSKQDTARPLGIITERDIVRIVGRGQDTTLQMPASDVMSKPIITIDATASLKDAIQAMEQKNIRRLPVVNREKKVVGIVTDKDIFRAIMASQTMVVSFCEGLLVDYRPVYERLGEFMLGETPMPDRSA